MLFFQISVFYYQISLYKFFKRNSFLFAHILLKYSDTLIMKKVAYIHKKRVVLTYKTTHDCPLKTS